jgi:hypothetical protein
VFWSQHIGTADVFVSHMQKTRLRQFLVFLGGGPRAVGIPEKAQGEALLFWTDYLTVRQCQQDFDLAAIRRVIKQIGVTLVEMVDASYFTRSFCVFETFATMWPAHI